MGILLYWIWLTQINGIGPFMQRALLARFTTPENVYKASFNDLIECVGIGNIIAKRIVEEKNLDRAKKILDTVTKLNIKLLTIEDSLYPVYVKKVKESPILLYYKGKLIENSIGVGIVGSRRCSEYGKIITLHIASYLAKKQIIVVSGMAKGIDSLAHTACIKSRGYTIAILANGLDICYPSEHKDLMDRIIQNGAIISEYPPGTRPNQKHFPKRNRLISAWSRKILVVEAGEKSGALITAKYGFEYNREVIAVPGDLFRRESRGTNRLISQGAAIFLNRSQLDIEERYTPITAGMDFDDSIEGKKVLDYDSVERQILGILISHGSMYIDELNLLVNIDKMNLLEKISLMELDGIVMRKGAGLFLTMV